jgi:hypothetical protein
VTAIRRAVVTPRHRDSVVDRVFRAIVTGRASLVTPAFPRGVRPPTFLHTRVAR